jgi:energy-coupling factor transport system permease protein
MVAAIYLAPLAAICFSFSSPLVLVATGLAALLAAALSGATRAALAPLRYGVFLAVTVVLVNVLVSQRGDTILLRGWELPVLGQVNVTLEALAEGGILALRILVALVVFSVWSACVDPDRILKAVRPFAARSALTATLISRLVPIAASDASRLGEAAELRGPAAAPVGRAALARRLVAGALDRSVDIAATLELRGYGLGTPSRVRSRRAPGEPALVLAGALMVAAAIAAAAAGVGRIETYPEISGGFELGTALFALSVPILVALPFCAPAEVRRLRNDRARRARAA